MCIRDSGYGVRGFVRDNLPIIPDTFTLVPRQVRTEKGYKPDSGVVSQIKVIKRQMCIRDRHMAGGKGTLTRETADIRDVHTERKSRVLLIAHTP